MSGKPELENDPQFRRLTLELSIANAMSGELSRRDMPFEYTKFFNVLHKDLEQQLGILYGIEHEMIPPKGALAFNSITRTWAETNLFPGFQKETDAPDMENDACRTVGPHTLEDASSPPVSKPGKNPQDRRSASKVGGI